MLSLEFVLILDVYLDALPPSGDADCSFAVLILVLLGNVTLYFNICWSITNPVFFLIFKM